MFSLILGLIIGVVATLAILASRKPDYFNYYNSVVINAPAAAIYPEAANLRKSNEWSPWLKLDPNARVTYNDIIEGVGASTHWAGNKHVGQGNATITETIHNELVVTRLDFIKPMKATNKGYFKLAEENGKTTVTWGMEGKAPFIGNVFGLFFDCEKMMKGQFETGLRNLKRRVEGV